VNARRTGFLSEPAAAVETVPVPHGNDAADDPAIWIHPDSPELSLILGTDKQGGLRVYNLDGSERAVLGDSKPNNVDVIYGVHCGTSRVDVVVASTRGKNARGLQVWTIDPRAREFQAITKSNAIPVLAGTEPYGCCGYRSQKTGEAYVFVTSKSGATEQYLLRLTGAEGLEVQRVGEFKFASTIEACVADEELGVVYFGEESRGIWKVAAEPGEQRVPELIARVGDYGLAEDVEGLAIYHGRGGEGYLIVSSQGNDQFKIYSRSGANAFIGTIDPVRGRFGDVEDTDGIDVTSANLGPLFPKGLFIVQDGKNGKTNQNFKLFRWDEIAGTNLIVVPTRR
jgi:3-phytase